MILVLLMSLLLGEGIDERIANAKELRKNGDRDGANAIYQSVVKELKQRSEASDALVRALRGLGKCARDVGNLEDAARMFEEARELAVKLRSEHAFWVHSDLVETLMRMDRFEDARKLDLKVLTELRAQGDGESPAAARLLRRLGVIEAETRNYEKALEYLDAALEVVADHALDIPEVFSAILRDMGGLNVHAGKLHVGFGMIAASLQFEQKRGTPTIRLVSALLNTAGILQAIGKLDRAADIARDALSNATEHLAPTHPMMIRCRTVAAFCLARASRADEAEKALEGVPDDHEESVRARCWIAIARKDHVRAIKLARKTLEAGATDPRLFRHPLAVALTRSGKYAEGQEVYAQMFADWEFPYVRVAEDYAKCLREGDIHDPEVEKLLEELTAREKEDMANARETMKELRELLTKILEQLK